MGENIWMSGNKNDQEKPMMALIPPYAEEEMAKAFTYGAQKYGTHNWLGGISVTRLLSASRRHINAVLKGEDIDEESGNHHLGHALASIAMAYETLKMRPDLDDRAPYKKKDTEENKNNEWD